MKYNNLQLIDPTAKGIVVIEKSKLVKVTPQWIKAELEPRFCGKFKGYAIYLNTDRMDWCLGMDNEGTVVLVPIKKK